MGLTLIYHEKTGRRVEVFQPDEQSHRERMQSRYDREDAERLRDPHDIRGRHVPHRPRGFRAALRAVPGWWEAASPFERALRVWWWGMCALIGLGLGGALVALIGGVWIAATQPAPTLAETLRDKRHDRAAREQLDSSAP